MHMFSSIKLAVITIVVSSALGLFAYVQILRSDLRIATENTIKLTQMLETQKAVIAQQKADWESIKAANQQLQTQQMKLTQELSALTDRFYKLNASGQRRDIGALALQKPDIVERVINTATNNAMRCIVIAMGAPLTEKEKNASKKSEINPECPAIANPNYNITYD